MDDHYASEIDINHILSMLFYSSLLIDPCHKTDKFSLIFLEAVARKIGFFVNLIKLPSIWVARTLCHTLYTHSHTHTYRIIKQPHIKFHHFACVLDNLHN